MRVKKFVYTYKHLELGHMHIKSDGFQSEVGKNRLLRKITEMMVKEEQGVFE